MLFALAAFFGAPILHAENVPASGLSISLLEMPPGPYSRPAYITLAASFSGADGTANSVSFYEDDGLIGTAPVSAPGFAVYYPQNVSVGTHRYTAMVSDGTGSATSNEVSYEVIAGPPPEIDLIYPEPLSYTQLAILTKVVAYPFDTTVTVDYGLTNAYGMHESVTLPVSTALQLAYVRLKDLKPAATYHFRVTATHADGSDSSTDRTFTMATLPTPVADLVASAGRTAGTVLEDAPGFQLSKLGVPTITNLGRIVATASARGPGGKLSGIVFGQAVAGDQGPATTFRMPLRVGDSADALGAGLAWKAFPREAFLDYADDGIEGEAAAAEENPLRFGFYGRLSGQGISAANDDVLGYCTYSFQTGGKTLLAVAREGGDAPGVPGGAFKCFVAAAMALKYVEPGDLDPMGETIQPGPGIPVHQPAIMFTALLRHQPGVVDSTNDMGLWLWQNGALRLILREGSPVGDLRFMTTLPKGPTVRSFAALRGPNGAFTPDRDMNHFNGSTPKELSTIVQINFSDGSRQLAFASVFGVKPLLTLKQPEWAGHILATFSAIKAWFRTPAGETGVLGRSVDAGGIDLIAFEPSPFVVPAELRQLVRADTPPGYLFLTTPPPAMNSEKTLAFGSRPARGLHVWYQRTDEDGAIQPFFTMYENAPGTPEGHMWDKVRSLAVPDGMGPLFTASLMRNNGVTVEDDYGLWAVDSIGERHLLLREGFDLLGKTVRSFKAMTSVSGSLSQTRTFNGKRQVLVQVMATDASQHWVRFAIP